MTHEGHIALADNPTYRAPLGEQGGLFLLWSLALSGFILLFIVGYWPFFNRTLRVTQTSLLTTQEIAAAEAGVEDALWEINEAGTWDRRYLAQDSYGQSASGNVLPALVDWATNDGIILISDIGAQDFSWFHTKVGWTSKSAASCQGFSPCFEKKDANVVSAEPGSTQTLGSYTVQVRGIGAKTLTNANPAIGTYHLPGFGLPQAQIVSTSGNRTVQVILGHRLSDFRYAAFGAEQTWIGFMTTIDSYDSSVAPYDPLFPGTHGDIGTNASGTWTDDLYVQLDPSYQVKGAAYVTPGAGSSIGAGELTGPLQQQMSETMPHVVIPKNPVDQTDLSSLPWATQPGAGGVTDPVINEGNGVFTIQPWGTWTCNGPMRVRALAIAGTFYMDNGCLLFVDNSTGTPTPRIFETPVSGQIIKRGTDTTKIFIKNNRFALGAGGVTRAGGVSLNPELFQIYQTCSLPCAAVQSSELAPPVAHSAFRGVVYVENGDLTIRAGNENSTDSNAEYFGAFTSAKRVIVSPWSTNHFVLVHYDEALVGLPLDGTGRPPPPADNVTPLRTWKILSWTIQ